MTHYQGTYKDLIVEVKHEHQLWITLNNPKNLNAITYEMIDSLCTILPAADFDPKIRVVVITGSGKNFCTGGDIKAMENQSGMFAGNSDELRRRYMHGIQKIPKAMEDLSTPVIAMVNGAAIGAGLDLSMMCDLRIGSNSTRMGETFTKMGLVPGDGGTFFLTRVLGFSKAMQMFLTAEIFEGEKAYLFGLLNLFTSDDQLEIKTVELANKICELSPIAQSMTKKAMKQSYLSDLHSALDMLASFQGIAQRTNDHKEAIAAFNEKRAAKFNAD
jgi:2-(1,2-epoxy-1,2-dihydrophenyl)acetyl-CoA isomerase